MKSLNRVWLETEVRGIPGIRPFDYESNTFISEDFIPYDEDGELCPLGLADKDRVTGRLLLS